MQWYFGRLKTISSANNKGRACLISQRSLPPARTAIVIAASSSDVFQAGSLQLQFQDSVLRSIPMSNYITDPVGQSLGSVTLRNNWRMPLWTLMNAILESLAWEASRIMPLLSSDDNNTKRVVFLQIIQIARWWQSHNLNGCSRELSHWCMAS